MGSQAVVVAVGVLLLVLPAIGFFATCASLFSAADPPAQASRNLRRAALALGAAFLFVPLALLLELVAPGLAAPRHGEPIDRRWTVAAVAYAAIVATPLVAGRTWIRRLAPTRRIGWYATLAGLSIALEFVLFDAVSRYFLGSDL